MLHDGFLGQNSIQLETNNVQEQFSVGSKNVKKLSNSFEK